MGVQAALPSDQETAGLAAHDNSNGSRRNPYPLCDQSDFCAWLGRLAEPALDAELLLGFWVVTDPVSPNEPLHPVPKPVHRVSSSETSRRRSRNPRRSVRRSSILRGLSPMCWVGSTDWPLSLR